MSEAQPEADFIELEKMSIDQMAGAFVLIMGAIGSLLLVIWQSKCRCSCRIGLSDKCYLFDCVREAPTTEELKTLADETKALAKKDKKDKKEKNKSADMNRESEPSIDIESQKNLSRTNSFIIPNEPQADRPQGEPEPEPEIIA